MTVPRIRMNPPKPQEPMGFGSKFAVIVSLDLAAFALFAVVAMCAYKTALFFWGM